MGRGDELWRKALKLYHISLGVPGSHIELSVMECQGERPEIVADILTCLLSMLRAMEDTVPETLDMVLVLLRLGRRVASVPSPDPTSMPPFGSSWRDWMPQLSLFFGGP